MPDGRDAIGLKRSDPPAGRRSAFFASSPDDRTGAEPVPPATPYRYVAFLSYSHADSATANWLHEALEKFRVPANLVGRQTANGVIPARLQPIFRDRHELAASGDLGHEIREALSASRFLIVLCSPAAAASRWTAAEVDSFKRLRPEGCVLAAIVAGEPFASDLPGREGEECFPPPLRHAYDKRGRPTGKRAEPIAADLRAGGDGKRLALLKIIAGMLGVGLDELVQREAQRRQKRLTYIAAASLVGMTVTSGLAVYAFDKRDEARDQRREAEGLVGFMLGDLRAKLEPLGRLDALDAVGARALGYFEQQDKADLTDAALAQRSKAVTLLGEIASSRGDLDSALRRYREAMAGTAEALRRLPDDEQRIYDHAQNVFWVGDIALQRGQNATAEERMREYRRLAQRLVALDPSKPKWQMERIYADANLGIVLFRGRRYPDAAVVFQASLAGIERLVASAPSNTEYRRALIETLAWLSDAREQEGRLDEALAQRERQLALLTPLMLKAGDVENRRQSVVAHRAAGRLFVTRGDLDKAGEHIRHAVRGGEELTGIEPDNADWAGMVAGPHLDLAEHLLIGGRLDDAGAATRTGCGIANRLVERDSTNKFWRVDLRSQCLAMRARLAVASGSGADANRSARHLVVLTRAEDRTASTPETRLALASAELLRAIVATATGNAQDARYAYRKASIAWPRDLSLTPRSMAQKVVLLDGLGRRDDAARLAARLEVIGFRHPTYVYDRRWAQRV